MNIILANIRLLSGHSAISHVDEFYSELKISETQI